MESSRLPGKPLINIGNKSMIRRVYESAIKANQINELYVATPNKEIFDHVNEFGKVIMTSNTHVNGTSRVAEAVEGIDCSHVVLAQGDEPLLNPSDIQKVIDYKLENMDSVVNCMSRFDSSEATNRNIPKVVSNFNNNLVYMSRSAIPGTKEGHSKLNFENLNLTVQENR